LGALLLAYLLGVAMTGLANLCCRSRQRAANARLTSALAVVDDRVKSLGDPKTFSAPINPQLLVTAAYLATLPVRCDDPFCVSILLSNLA
jgi:hypothetical protein